MSKRDVFEFEQIEKFLSGKQRRNETSILLGQTERTVTRKARRVESKGLLGIKHGNTGKRPRNKKSDLLKAHVFKLIRNEYFDYNMSHLQETLKSANGITVAYTTLRRWCHEINVVKRRYRKQVPNQRKKRARMANEGFLLQMDGSPHFYVPCKEWVLIAAIDDATNNIAAAEFYETENTFNCMDILEQVIRSKGRPWGIYVDRAGWMGGGKRQNFSEFKRACEELEIEVIYANSPEGKGRVERLFRTLQDRLIPEMRTVGITDYPAANEYIKNVYIPHLHNPRFAVQAENTAPAWRAIPSHINLEDVFCIKENRRVANDHTFSYQGEKYLIETDLKFSIYNHDIELRTTPDGKTKAIFAGRQLTFTKITPCPKRIAA